MYRRPLFAWKTRGKLSELMLMVFRLEILTGDNLESDAEFKTLLLHPQITKNTAHCELATLPSGSGRLMYFHPRTGRESLLATHCNYRPF